MSPISEELEGSSETVLSKGLKDRKPRELPLPCAGHREGCAWSVQYFRCWVPLSILSKRGTVNGHQEDQKKEG